MTGTLFVGDGGSRSTYMFLNWSVSVERYLNNLLSLKAAYDGSIHTVLTSGLIMVVVTGIIGAISTDPAVGPICLTLSIGSASAILLILFVLPGMLAAFDKIILPKTKKKKEK